MCGFGFECKCHRAVIGQSHGHLRPKSAVFDFFGRIEYSHLLEERGIQRLGRFSSHGCVEIRFVLEYPCIKSKLRDTEDFCRDIDDRGLPRDTRLRVSEGFEVENFPGD